MGYSSPTLINHKFRVKLVLVAPFARMLRPRRLTVETITSRGVVISLDISGMPREMAKLNMQVVTTT